MSTADSQALTRTSTAGLTRPSDQASVWARLKYDLFDFPLYVMGHPFKGFGDVKFEGQGQVYVGVILLLLNALVAIVKYVYTGFIINKNDPYELNVLLTSIFAIAPSLLFMIGNWSITTLMGGTGSMRDIFIVLTYAQYLTIPLTLIHVLLSNVLTQEEMAIASFFLGLAAVLYGLYAFIGLLVIHEFGFLRGLGAVLLTILAVLLILFILILLTSLVGELILFLRTLIREALLRITA